jgi:hypothetical protein
VALGYCFHSPAPGNTVIGRARLACRSSVRDPLLLGWSLDGLGAGWGRGLARNHAQARSPCPAPQLPPRTDLRHCRRQGS